jgi:phospholipid/cholesterol/gamma-HCH transport system substrate-binding protein
MVAAQRDALAETLTNAPVALSNLQNAYNGKTGTLDTRSNVNENLTPQTLLCNLLVASGQPASACRGVESALKPVTDRLGAGLQLGGADPTLGGLLGGSR